MKKLIPYLLAIIPCLTHADSLFDSVKWKNVDASKNEMVKERLDQFLKNCQKLTKEDYLKFTNLEFRGLPVKYYIPYDESGEGSFWGYVFESSQANVRKAIPELDKNIKMTKEDKKSFSKIKLFINYGLDSGFAKNLTWVSCGGTWKPGAVSPGD